MAEVIQDIQYGQVNLSAYIEASFDEAKEALEKKGYEIISLQENAKLRIQEGKNSHISREGNFVKEGIISIPKKGNFLTKNSPVLKNPREAYEAHGYFKSEFYISNKEVEKAMQNSVQVPYNKFSVPTNRFGQDKITVFVFGETAKEYGKFLKEAGISKMSLYFHFEHDVNNKKQAFANQLWLNSLKGGSSALFSDKDLSYGHPIRGIKKTSVKDFMLEKIPYSQKEVVNISNILQEVREGRLPNSKLEKIIEFIGRLRE